MAQRHFLACFDLTFREHGNHGAGLGPGTLCQHDGPHGLLYALHRET